MAEKEFNTAAEPQAKPPSAGYVFDYEKEVAEFHRDFPHLKEKIYFVDMTPTSAKTVKGELEDVSAIDAELEKSMVGLSIKRMQPINQSFTVNRGRDGYYIVLAQTPARSGLPRLMGRTASDDIESLNTLDHEIGHAVTRDGFTSPGGSSMRESVADAYAAIRHIQRFGVDEWLNNMVETRAVELVFRRDMAVHFSSPVLQAVLEAAKTTDFKSLTPQQTAIVANNFGLAHAVHPQAQSEMRENFRVTNDKLADVAKGNLGPLRDLALVVLSTDSAATFKWGAVALRAFLDGNILVDGVHIRLQEKYWKDIRTSLDRRELEHGKDNLFAPKSPYPNGQQNPPAKPQPLQGGPK